MSLQTSGTAGLIIESESLQSEALAGFVAVKPSGQLHIAVSAAPGAAYASRSPSAQQRTRTPSSDMPSQSSSRPLHVSVAVGCTPGLPSSQSSPQRVPSQQVEDT